MSPFESALLREEQWLCVVSELPMPNGYLSGSRVYIGPARPPANAPHYLDPVDPSVRVAPLALSSSTYQTQLELDEL
jgi:hypothetical protein